MTETEILEIIERHRISAAAKLDRVISDRERGLPTYCESSEALAVLTVLDTIEAEIENASNR